MPIKLFPEDTLTDFLREDLMFELRNLSPGSVGGLCWLNCSLALLKIFQNNFEIVFSKEEDIKKIQYAIFHMAENIKLRDLSHSRVTKYIFSLFLKLKMDSITDIYSNFNDPSDFFHLVLDNNFITPVKDFQKRIIFTAEYFADRRDEYKKLCIHKRRKLCESILDQTRAYIKFIPDQCHYVLFYRNKKFFRKFDDSKIFDIIQNPLKKPFLDNLFSYMEKSEKEKTTSVIVFMIMEKDFF